jgi:hypothetical protein
MVDALKTAFEIPEPPLRDVREFASAQSTTMDALVVQALTRCAARKCILTSGLAESLPVQPVVIR